MLGVLGLATCAVIAADSLFYAVVCFTTPIVQPALFFGGNSSLCYLPGLLLHGQRLWQQHQRQLRLCLTDWLVLAFCGVALLSTLNAELRAVAVTEMRIMVLEPAILYFGHSFVGSPNI